MNDEKLCKLPTFGTQYCLEILQCYTVFTFPNFPPTTQDLSSQGVKMSAVKGISSKIQGNFMLLVSVL